MGGGELRTGGADGDNCAGGDEGAGGDGRAGGDEGGIPMKRSDCDGSVLSAEFCANCRSSPSSSWTGSGGDPGVYS